MNITIRQLEEEDIQIIASSFTKIGSKRKTAALYRRYLTEQEIGERLVLLAFKDNNFVGYVTIHWKSDYPQFAEKGIPEIQDLNVLPDFRRRGIGSSLVDEAEKQIFERSRITGIGVGMYADYGTAQRMYILRGYVPDGRGLFYKDQPVIPGREVLVDDDLVLYFTKDLNS
ncbi:GNAT family N-acetyltransferase [Chloroflexota bacterium]